jgi:CRISPR-associated protein Csx14
MSDKEANIRIPVDLTNPGQFFACCGLLELADRLWPGAEGWFQRREFCILTGDRSKSLRELLDETRLIRFDVGDDSEAEEDADETDDKNSPIDPIRLQWKNEKPAILLDWWSDKSIKPWAGSMKERVILRAMLTAIDPSKNKPFDDLRRVQYQSPNLDKKGRPLKPQKKEPFYFDPRRGNKSHPLDCGFSPDTHKMEAECCPALEALCFIGLQRARPGQNVVANQSRYNVWTKGSDDDPGLVLNAIALRMAPCISSGNKSRMRPIVVAALDA